MDQLNTTLSMLTPKTTKAGQAKDLGPTELFDIDDLDSQGQDSLDAALAFASALLTATSGNELPTSGNILPDILAADELRATRIEPPLAELPFAGLPVIDDDSDAALVSTLPIASLPSGLLSDNAVSSSDTALASVPEDIIDQVRSILHADRIPRRSRIAAGDQSNLVGIDATMTKVPVNREASELGLPVRKEPLPATSVVPVQTAELVSRQNQSTRAATLETLRRISLPANRVNEAQGLPLSAAAVSVPPAAATSQAPLPVAPTVVVEHRVSEQGWSREFSEKVGWVINARLPSAQIKLNPEHLGPVELQVEVEDKQARIQFSALHGMTREVIEQSIPRLREALEQQGLSLAEADVSGFDQKNSGAQQETSADPDDATNRSVEGASESVTPVAEPDVTRLVGHGLIDTFV